MKYQCTNEKCPVGKVHFIKTDQHANQDRKEHTYTQTSRTQEEWEDGPLKETGNWNSGKETFI